MANRSFADNEKIIERLKRRVQKVAKAMVSPFPISSAVKGDDVSGDILRYLFCADGKITKGRVFFPAKPKEAFQLEVKIENEEGGNSVFYSVSKRTAAVEPNIEVKAGDRLTISVISLSDDLVTECWVSFLWLPTVADADAKTFLMQELEVEDDIPSE